MGGAGRLLPANGGSGRPWAYTHHKGSEAHLRGNTTMSQHRGERTSGAMKRIVTSRVLPLLFAGLLLLLAPIAPAGASPSPIPTGVVFYDGFEGSDSAWTYRGTPSWATTTYRAAVGQRSAYCVGSQVAAPGPYSNDVESWMTAGPFDLSKATAAVLKFKLYMSTQEEADYIGWYVSIDGEEFWGMYWSGDSQGWTDVSMDLTDVYTLGNVCGRDKVWVAFIFESDATTDGEGAYVDEVRLLSNAASRTQKTHVLQYKYVHRGAADSALYRPSRINVGVQRKPYSPWCVLKNVHWAYWSRTSARGTGTMWNLAGGGFWVHHPARVTLSRPVWSGMHPTKTRVNPVRYFTRLDIRSRLGGRYVWSRSYPGWK